jgi:glycogen debranching enzyme
MIPRRSFLRGAGAALSLLAASALVSQVSALDSLDPSERNKLATQLQKLLVSDDPKLLEFATEVYATCVLGKIRPPDPPLKHAWIVPGGGYYAQWLWDTMFVVDLLSLLPGQEEIIRGVFQNYWDFQQRWDDAKPAFMHGMIANFIAPYNSSGSRDGKQWREFPAYSQAPLLGWGMERVYQRNRDIELLRAGIEPLERFHEWYWRERDIRELGLVGVGSYDGDTQDARYETYDREVDLDDLKMISHPGRPAGKDNGAWYGDIAIPANTAYLLTSELALTRMAALCGDHEMANRRKTRYAKGVAAVRKYMWDERSGCFLAVRVETMEKIRRPTVGGFMPAMSQIATGVQAKTMANMLTTPAWATQLAIPTVAQTDPQFRADEFWRGDVWPAPNYQIAGGLAAYGLHDAAARISDGTVANALKAGISEHYDSFSGRPLGVAGLGMSATMLTMMLDGLTSDRYRLRVRG